MRHIGRSVLLVALLAWGVALAGECVNESKPDGAGNHGDVVIDGATGDIVDAPTNPAGRVIGGFADVYIDTDGDGEGDVQAVDDTFIAGNHSQNEVPGQDSDGDGVKVLPSVDDGQDPGGEGAGVGHGAH